MSTTTKSGYAQPALIGGVVMGVLSALPIVSGGNLCCCLWVVSGGAEAVPGIQHARAMGLHVVVSDANPSAPGLAASASTARYSAIETGAGPEYRVLESPIWSLRVRPCLVIA